MTACSGVELVGAPRERHGLPLVRNAHAAAMASRRVSIAYASRWRRVLARTDMSFAFRISVHACVCRKPYPCCWSERIGYPGGMIALILFVLGILASPFKAKSRLEAENAALRQQLIVLRRKVKSWPRLANTDRWFFVLLYRWFPSILDVLTIIRPETLVRWHRAGFRRYWHWKSRRRGGRPQVQSELRALIRQMSVENPLWGAPRIHGELLKLGFEVSQSIGLAGNLRRAGDVAAAMLASGCHHIAPGCGIWMQRPMRASVRLAFWLARRIIRRLASLRWRRARIVRRLKWQAKFGFEFGDACPKRGVFRNQSVDLRYQRDNQRVFLRQIK